MSKIDRSYLEARFRSLGRSGRKWTVRFELPRQDDNKRAAVDYALRNNATVEQEKWVTLFKQL